MTTIIAVLSHKGGTGKTSLVQNLGYELGKQKRVLLVDFDPQSNLTVGCGIEPYEERQTVFHTMYDPNTTANTIISLDHYDLLPSNLDLALAEQQFAAYYDRNNKLQDAIAMVQDKYDYVLIDSPPSMGFFAFNALTAANEVLIPLQCQPYALRAVDNTLQLVKLVQKNNRDLHVRSVVLTMYDKRVALTKSVEAAARQRFKALVAQAVIPVNISVSEAGLEGQPVAIYAPRSRGAQSYQALSQELY
ncbi:MAG: ParA family protein [Candidatus Promineifilaceae bacterium]